VWLLTAANAVIGAVLYAWVLVRLDGANTGGIPFALLLVLLFGSAEVFVVHFEFRRDSHTFSLVEMPLVLGLLFAQPALIVPAHVLGAGLALAFYRKQSSTKLLFNLAAFTLEDSVAVLIFHRLAGTIDVTGFNTSAGAVAGAVVASVLGMVAVFAAIALSGGRLSRSERRQALTFGLLATGMTTSVTMIVAIMAEVDPAAAWLPLVPVAGIYLAHRIYVSERNERQRLEFLHQSTGLLNESKDIDWVVDSLLNQARRTFGADVAALNYLPAGDLESLALTVVGPGDEHQSLTSIPRSTLLDAWERTAGSEGRTVTDLRSDIELLIPEVAIRDALVIPLRSETQVIGYLLVANRLSPVSRFSHDDLRVFQTLGRHVSVALENGQLEQSLQEIRVLERQVAYRATHDTLTGLANGVLVQEALTGRLAATEPDNTTLIVLTVTPVSRDAGAIEGAAAVVADKLRMVVAQRLRRCLRDHDLVARLDSDTFCVVADTPGGEVVSWALAERLRQVLGARITIDAITVPTELSIGLVVNRNGDQAEGLLARALGALSRARDRSRAGDNGAIESADATSDEISRVNS
jgi:GGDEF domain-containing protein